MLFCYCKSITVEHVYTLHGIHQSLDRRHGKHETRQSAVSMAGLVLFARFLLILHSDHSALPLLFPLPPLQIPSPLFLPLLLREGEPYLGCHTNLGHHFQQD